MATGRGLLVLCFALNGITPRAFIHHLGVRSNMSATNSDDIDNGAHKAAAGRVGQTGEGLEDPRPPTAPPELKYIFMRYMPERNTVVCGCAKCGTSSVYNYIYEKEFGHTWNFKDEPYIHEVDSNRWAGKWQVVHDVEEQSKLMDSAYSLVLIRDPKERLISAWKSKIACGGLFHTDYATRSWMTSELRKLAGFEDNETCLELEDFLEALAAVHANGKAYLLDRHFLPQNLGCFFRTPAEKWSKVATISDGDALQSLAERLRTEDTHAPADHSSTAKVLISQLAEQLLDNITRTEYNFLANYLHRPTWVHSGKWALDRIGTAKISKAAEKDTPLL